ncbi:ABC transporter B family member 13 isoform X3 [Magnolia sinica]|uniref:ABC transporter B family member 13 isoform X3 n=1 Tax=Magnolia sinica TaxID=86752 RepID=UPI00265956AA|nr:ABC transporter B family member 13 isoform X3 [Magnolia sinica]
MDGVELSNRPSDNNPIEKPAASRRKASRSIFGLFAVADTVDCFLMLFGAAGACIHGASTPVFLILFGHIIDSLGSLSSDPHKLASEVSKRALDLVYVGLIVLVGAWIGVAFWTQTGERQTARLRVKYLQSVLRKDINFFDTEARDANIIYRISSDAILVQDAIGDKTGHCLRYLAQFVVGFAVGFTTLWKLTLVTLAVIPLLVVAGGAYTIIMSTLSKKGEAAYAEAGKVAEEVISQVRTVYSFVGEEKAVEAYSKLLKTALKLGKKSGFAKGIGVGTTYGLLFCTWAFLLWYAGILVRHHVTNGGKAFTTIINVVFSGFALGQAAPNLSAIAKGQAAISNIISMIDVDSKSTKTLDRGIVLPEVAGKIEFSKVSFAYPSRPNMIFEDLSFLMSAGKTFAVVGPSGSGKSTIISMVERFYEPTSGKILLDGFDLKILQLKWLRGQMGLVSQEPALFATSIAGNILYGREDAELDHIVEAAKAANAHSFIQALPEGYHTQVGEGGTQLSGGQKQRIAIARAVLRNPKILLLDEATSALDAESELVVQQALERIMLDRTTIIVAHRLSTIRDVDKIIVLKNGKVVESGTHFELMSKGEDGEYATLVSLQVSSNVKVDSFMNSSRTSHFSELNHTQAIHKKSESIDGRETLTHDQRLDRLGSASSPSIGKLIRMNRAEWPNAVLGSVGAIISGMQTPLFALGITQVLSAFYSHDQRQMKHEIEKVALIFVGAAIVTVPVYLVQHYFYTAMGEQITTRVRLSIFSAILRNEIGWFDLDENNSGTLASMLAADATLVRSAIADRLSTIIQNISLVATAFFIAFFLSWRMAAVVLATYPLIISAAIAEQMFLRGLGGNYTRAYSRATAIAREAIINIRTVAAFGAEDRISAQFTNELEQPNKQALVRGHISGLSYGISQLFLLSSYALGLWYASQLIKKKESDFGNIMKSFMVLIVTALGVAEALALAPDIVKGSHALGSVFSILERRTAIESDDPLSQPVIEIRGDVEFKDVGFRYPVRPDVPVFDGLNLQVPAGSSLAIVGPSGSGKSSVIALLMRFYDPIKGAVMIDGRDIRCLNLRTLRLRIGLVQQEPVLFSTTIYENILYGRDGASEIEIMKAAKAANAHGFISRMPDGYQTHVGERGIQLSGGQKQRVAIARAILKDPTILLLDEATSALDTASEKLVQEALDTLMYGRTTVMVAHRLSTIRDADRIAVLHCGKVAEIGGHDELISRPGSMYSQLVRLQQQSADGDDLS